MEHAGAWAPLHTRLMRELDRGTRALQQSRELIATHAVLDAQVRATLTDMRTQRHKLRAARRRD